MSCGLFYDPKKQKTLLALSNGQIVYRGYKPDTSQDLMRTMLVLHNKKTGKVRLVQVERWQVNAVLEKPATEENKSAESDKIVMLNRQFGSKKAKRKIEQYERMKINVDTVKEQLEETVSNVEVDKADLSVDLAENDDIINTALPPCNRDATNVTDVYDVHDIIPEDKLETLYAKAKEILNDNDNDFDGKTKFFVQILRQLQYDPDNVKKTALLLYVQAVMTWLNLPIRDTKKRNIVVCPSSSVVNTHIIDTYSIQSNSGRQRPNSAKDKGVIHCMILALIICNFVLDIELYSKIFSYRVGQKKLMHLARIIGALPNKEDKRLVTLKVPLPAPVSTVNKTKKKK
nr:PREDICTED: DNA-directed RNA polymerase I subunit rpa49-like isoform X2 [Megachile rotundata]